MDTSYSLHYLGHSLIHSYVTDSMLQWIITEIELCRRTHSVTLILTEQEIELKRNFVSRIPSTGTSDNHTSLEMEPDSMNLAEDLMKFDDLNDTITYNSDNPTLPFIVESILKVKYNKILHSVQVQRGIHTYFVLVISENDDKPIYCHAFQADVNAISIIRNDIEKRIDSMVKSGTKCIFKKLGVGSDSQENNDNDCVRFEVMLVGIVNLKNPDPAHTLIDEAVSEFDQRYKQLEHKRNQNYAGPESGNLYNLSTSPGYIDSGSPSNSHIDDSREGSMHMLQKMRQRCSSFDQHDMQRPSIRRRQRHRSEPSNNNGSLQKTRIRLFQIGHNSIKMVCPNKSVKTSEIEFASISRCMQGIKNRDHFGIIANTLQQIKQHDQDDLNKHNNGKRLICYVFKCAEEYLCEEIMQGIRQAFATSFNDASPMQEFDALCKDINVVSAQEALRIAKHKMQELEVNEIKCIKAQILEINPKNSEDKLAAFMAALRQLYEVKHAQHLTDKKTATDLNEQLNPSESATSTLDNIKSKAISSFGNWIQKGKKKMQELQLDAEHLSDKHVTSPAQKFKFFAETLSNSAPNTPQKNTVLGQTSPKYQSTLNSESSRRRSTSLGSRPPSMEFTKAKSDPPSLLYHKIFYGITNTGPCAKQSSTQSVVYSPPKTIYEKPARRYQTVDDIRKAWKWAINQQVLLNKINCIKNTQVTDEMKHRTEYEDLKPVSEEMEDIWAELFQLSVDQKQKIEKRVLAAAIQKGVISNYRARVWKLLRLHVHCDDEESIKSKLDIEEYPRLLDNLTTYQHAILIDIGRTFPTHPMYRQLLGPGQLSLFNVLKAFSLQDKEVGYCQGLSFIAGVLLMHTCVEDEAYQLLYCLMNEVGCRTMYLPDMKGMKLAMYKLTRLLYDLDPDIYHFFELHDVTMMLVATPWFLTMFASTFPMNFVARIFDMVFLDGVVALFKVAICLLREHKSQYLEMDDFEDVVNYIRTEIPKSNLDSLAVVLENAMSMSIETKLAEYAVEYRMLYEELPINAFHTEQQKRLQEQIHCLESVNHKVTESNCDLMRQIHDAQHKVAMLQKQLREVTKNAKYGY